MHGPGGAGTCCEGLSSTRHQDVPTEEKEFSLCKSVHCTSSKQEHIFSLNTVCGLALLTFQCFQPANRQHLQMCKIPLFSYISDVSLGCVFWTRLVVIIREFLQTSYVMFLAVLLAQRGLSPDVDISFQSICL